MPSDSYPKVRKSATDLKVMIEEKLRRDHPACRYAEVIISPPAGGLPWSASVFGEGPAIDQECRRRIDGIVAQLREEYDLA